MLVGVVGCRHVGRQRLYWSLVQVGGRSEVVAEGVAVFNAGLIVVGIRYGSAVVGEVTLGSFCRYSKQ
jgi:hypothetical protein